MSDSIPTAVLLGLAGEVRAALRRSAEQEMQPYLAALNEADATWNTLNVETYMAGLERYATAAREALDKACELLGVER